MTLPINKYSKIYYKLIAQAQTRNISDSEYIELHHIIPEAFFKNRSRKGPKGWLDGDPEAIGNKVALTAREHFICHWLLKKMHTGRAYEICMYALNGMKREGKDNERYETKITSRVYAKLKEEFALVHSAYMKTKTPWNKGLKLDGEKYKTAGRKNKGKVHSAETIAKRVVKQIGVKRSDNTKANISASLKGKLKGPMSDEGKANISKATKGIKKSAEHTAKKTATLKALAASGEHHSKQRKTCPHCGTEMNRILYGRWHGDRCRQNPANNTSA